MSFITFARDEQKRHKARRELFYTCLIRRGVFQQPFHHGYICYRHTDEDLDYTVGAIDEALAIVARECP
jgi:3-aminobutanoyl-CoA transaminase